MFKYTYIDVLSKTNNAFAEWGSYNHFLLEKYYRREIELFDLTDAYKKDYRASIKCKFPPNAYKDLNKSYYESGIEYYNNFNDDFSEYTIIGVEQEIHLLIDKYKFIGYIDLILKDKDDNYIIVDHKSKSKFASKKEKKEYLRQLYLYSIYIKETYGKYPVKLIFNMFRTNEIIETDFSESECNSAKQWLIDTIRKIYEDKEFLCSPDEYFCNFLCSVRHFCRSSKDFIVDP